MIRAENNRIPDKAVLVFLDLLNLGSLVLRSAVVVNNTNATAKLLIKYCQLSVKCILAFTEKRLTAIAIAMSDSVTVSMGDETKGAFSVIFLVNADVRSWNFELFRWSA